MGLRLPNLRRRLREDPDRLASVPVAVQRSGEDEASMTALDDLIADALAGSLEKKSKEA